MSSTALLDAKRDRAAWREALEEIPVAFRDVYADPEYVQCYATGPRNRAMLFVYRRSGQVWIYPFLLRPIRAIGSTEIDGGYCDIETPYGYGGPIGSSLEADFVASAMDAFSEWCQSVRVVAEFIRVHPILKTQRFLDARVELIFDRETVSLDLKKVSAEKLPFDKKTQYMLRRAEKLDVKVDVSPSPDDFEQFQRLYKSAMSRKEAGEFYRFDSDYFECLRGLVSQGGFLLGAMSNDGRLVAGSVFLVAAELLHYHLAASDPAERLPGISNLLLLKAALVGKERGLNRLHLGGGVTQAPQDSLLRFKRTMATDSHSFFVGRRIHLPAAYEEMRAVWEAEYPALSSSYGERILFYRYSE